jgi:hypothetical protein
VLLAIAMSLMQHQVTPLKQQRAKTAKTLTLSQHPDEN